MTSFLSASVISRLRSQNHFTKGRHLAALPPLSYLSLHFHTLFSPDLIASLQVGKLRDFQRLKEM